MGKPNFPEGQSERSMHLLPTASALAVTNDTSITASTEVTLNTSTTLLDVTALTDGVFLKWGTDDVSSSDFDVFILANTTRSLQVPEGTTAFNIIDNGGGGQAIISEF